MQLITILGEILPVLGTVGLLGLWLYQQTGIERRAGEVRALQAARAEFQLYQSHNALFNAIDAAAGKPGNNPDQPRSFQIYNYELGLAALEKALSEADKAGIPAAVDAYAGPGSDAEKLERVQTRLGLLQTRIAAREATSRAAAGRARAVYVRLYVALSLMAVLGAVLKLVDKLAV